MLKELVEKEKEYLNHFLDTIDLNQAERILNELFNCKGTLIFSGVGKSGYIAKKAVSTFLSIGVKAFFLDPANALHGDLGFVSKEDLFLSLSKSGASFELVNLLPFIKAKGAKTVSIVSAKQSMLEKLSDLTIRLNVMHEICPHDLAPTTSCAAQLIFCDCLAVAFMKMKEVSVDDFARNHPGGLLGKKISMKVADLMLKGEDLPKASPNDLLISKLHELSVKKCGCLLVTDEKNVLKGIFTDGDLRRSIEKMGAEALHMPLEKLMTISFKSIMASKLADHAMKMMEEDPARLITVLPVIDHQKLVGLIRMHDILQQELIAK